ncbi:integral membrane pth11 protein [Rutstroemia sp. NJR-2017a BVV2]|nr:integral membrane pth11 protein [Rutstroemia sp. NJR-2017a BVV2]
MLILEMVENFIAEVWSTWAIAICFIFLRFYAKVTTVGWQKLALDDLFMMLAGLSYTAESIAAYFVAGKWLGLANSGMTDEQRATLDPDSQEWRFRVNGSKTHIIGWFTYTTLFWLLKGSWVVYYSRITVGLPNLRIRIKIGYVMMATTYIAAILLIIFKCFPLSKQWQIFPDPGNNCQPGYSKLQVSFIMAINTATELYLMTIPLPLIFKSQLPTRKKITVLVLFSGGFLVMAFGILRCVSLLTVGAVNPAVSGEWSVRESFVAVLVSNFVIVFPLFRRWWKVARGQSTEDSSMQPSYPLSNISGPKLRSKKSCGHPLYTPNDIAWGSEEAIVRPQNSGTAPRQNAQSMESMDAVELGNEGGIKTTVHAENYHSSGNLEQNSLPSTSSLSNQIIVIQEHIVHESTKEDRGLVHTPPKIWGK